MEHNYSTTNRYMEYLLSTEKILDVRKMHFKKQNNTPIDDGEGIVEEQEEYYQSLTQS